MAIESSDQPQSVLLRRWTHSSEGYKTRLDLGWLYSPQITEEQQQGFLQGSADASAAAGAGTSEAGATPGDGEAQV